MTEVLEKPAVQPIRRFGVADLTEQGPWIMERLLKLYSNQNQRSIIGWLNNVIDNNEFLCLYMPHAVCFAERAALDRLSGKLIVREIFVWVEDPKDAEQVLDACRFYEHMRKWALQQGIDRMIIGERSDVPNEELEKIFSKLHPIKTYFVRA